MAIQWAHLHFLTHPNYPKSDLQNWTLLFFLWPFVLRSKLLRTHGGARTSSLARARYACPLVTRHCLSQSWCQKHPKATSETSCPLKGGQMSRDLNGLKKKPCLASAQSSWCRFGSWMNFQCNCLALSESNFWRHSPHWKLALTLIPTFWVVPSPDFAASLISIVSGMTER